MGKTRSVVQLLHFEQMDLVKIVFRVLRDQFVRIYKNFIRMNLNGKCVVCGCTSNLVTDHKNDLYNDPRVLNTQTQTKEDFQCLCTHCNLQKRQIAIKTRKTEKRYGAINIPSVAIYGIDFINGDENYNVTDINAMVGTYWYDPVAFMEFIREIVL